MLTNQTLGLEVSGIQMGEAHFKIRSEKFDPRINSRITHKTRKMLTINLWAWRCRAPNYLMPLRCDETCAHACIKAALLRTKSKQIRLRGWNENGDDAAIMLLQRWLNAHETVRGFA